MALALASSALLVVATAVYTVLHFSTGNAMLVSAAAPCGLMWGYPSFRTGSVWPGIISLIIWDPLIFVIAPVR